MEFLLRRGAVAYPKVREFNAEVYFAAASSAWRNEAVIRYLLDLGADLNHYMGAKGTPLQAAPLSVCNFDAAKLLVDQGADVNPIHPSRPDLQSPLQIAADLGTFNLVKLLLAKGADQKDISLLGAAQHRRSNRNSKQDYRLTIQLLLDHGFDINYLSKEERSALHVAVQFAEELDLVQLLLKRGADVHIRGGPYRTVLQAAAVPRSVTKGQPLEIFKLLIGKGADINGVGGKYRTALQAAAYHCRTDAMCYLLQKGADANLSGGVHGNALQAAAALKCYRIKWPFVPAEFSVYSKVTTLLQAGANINAVGGKLGTAL
jgi:ankyrin repeat protein